MRISRLGVTDTSMPLPVQLDQALLVLDWLFNPRENRMEGRSRLMTVAFIRQALSHPGAEIRVFDHMGTRDTERITLALIRSFAEGDPLLQSDLLCRSNPPVIVWQGSRPIYDWYPTSMSELAPPHALEPTPGPARTSYEILLSELDEP